MLCTELCRLPALALSPVAPARAAGRAALYGHFGAECWGTSRARNTLAALPPAETEPEIASADYDALLKSDCSVSPFSNTSPGGKFGPEQMKQSCKEPEGRQGDKRLLQPKAKPEAAGSQRHGQALAQRSLGIA